MGRSTEVDAWFARYDNPMKPVVQRIREVILGVDPRVGECIKWQAPTFTFEGNIASFFPKAKQHASLMFHQGASIPGQHPILEGDGDTGRSIKLASVREVDEQAEALRGVIRAWIAFKGGGATAPRKAGAKTAGAKTAGAKTAAPRRRPARRRPARNPRRRPPEGTAKKTTATKATRRPPTKATAKKTTATKAAKSAAKRSR
ncbi:MAG: DUF1801 domain-containing protein [Nannocystaceae bacterium]